MRPSDVDPHVPKDKKTENELINDMERLEEEVDEYRKMIKFYNEALRNGTVSNIPKGKLFEYETAGYRLHDALALLEETRLELSNLMAA